MPALLTVLTPVVLAWTPVSPPFGTQPCLREPFRGITPTNEIGELIGEPDREDWRCVGERQGGHNVLETKGLISEEDVPLPPPTTVCFKEAYPNPATSVTRLTIELPERAHVKVILYAESFQHGPRRIDEIRTLVDTDLAAGLHQLQWDLTDAQGTRVPPGIYRAVLRVGEHSLCGDIEAR